MLRELAEYPNSFIEPTPGSERIETGRFTLCLTPGGATVQRQRFSEPELDDVLDEVRTLLRERDRTRTLVTQAGAMSRPILAALGFAAVGRVEMLVDGP